MRFGIFYEHQLPKPWAEGAEERLFAEALDQVVLADRLGYDNAWAVEHHFLEEYSHSSAPEVFLAAAAARTENIRLGHGIRQTPREYNHPARTAESVSTLDVISHGRVEFGIGEGATRLELGAFGIPAKEKRAMSLEAGEQIANMMTMTPYPGYEGKYFSMPCRNVIPKPVQKPHPPMWIACTNRDTIALAARCGLGALAFAFVDEDEAGRWVKSYYDIIKSEECVPLGHTVNANIAVVTSFSVHESRGEAIRRGHDGFGFFRYAIGALVARDTTPGRTTLWEDYEEQRGDAVEEAVRRAEAAGDSYSGGIGTTDDVRRHLGNMEEVGVDQVIFLQQGGRNRHEHICESLELFASEVMPAFHERNLEREERKKKELAPFVEAALARKPRMRELAEDEIPIVAASIQAPKVGGRP
ncbi:MAG: LLM class flavin-dependent oxidoreductase [Chloroflexi bacterium]|nr:LLM class flavin-dependent oxidoreductase [Chloroflexota bacterium]